ncbi:MAG: elongation factor P maturation arginine rhamnosyltransferase EarP [Aquabacterium sp.]|nr:elongation factor P maturation arginine rhamnosyltransferase EarP [Aquabacterium sp.]TAK85201.1 MAG: elongation factor P maturation arginine rhamnosyltransferase EarP [Aquabacterium sp.]
MLWDVFCRVIDNFGDIGVCWRLACDLGQRGQQVRLWVDDASALNWMAPQVQWMPADDATWRLPAGLGQPGVTVLKWSDAQKPAIESPGLRAGDVVVEAFGCDPPDAFIVRMQRRAAQGQPAQWVNLEYLSAEDYVERSHGLRSPVWSGAGAGLSKRFFYPGFTPATGGLLREPDLIQRRRAETASPAQRLAFLKQIGLDLGDEAKLILLFCYESAPVTELLDRLAGLAGLAQLAPQTPHTHVLLTPGHATTLATDWAHAHPGHPLHLHPLPALPQDDFDRLLWCCDLNLVRGEDSAVRALWAGRPHIWHIYEQDDGVHAGKLDAFMARWMVDWPADLRAQVRDWWLAWNRLAPMPETLPSWQANDAPWRQNSENARDHLALQQDLASQLLTFVSSSG